MKWEGNRESDNVEDRRGGGGLVGGTGLGIGTIVLAILGWAGWDLAAARLALRSEA